MVKIAIIGAGQLGSRHLQALAALPTQAHISVIDPSADSLKTAETRFAEVSANFKGTVSFGNSISLLDKKLDVVIVATNSKIRRQVIEMLLDHSQVSYLILEKFLFVNRDDYKVISELLIAKNVAAWVNCPRRMMDFYKDLKARIKGSVHFAVTGNDWGMGCNSIHFFDLFAFLTGAENCVLSNLLIDNDILESKRKDYIEFTGTITGQTKEHSLRITSFAGTPSNLIITIDTATARYYIEEGAKGIVRIASAENDWKQEEKYFEMPFQSQLTNVLVNELIETGTCSLPTYKESSVLHLQLLDNFISFLRRVRNDNSINECPIT